jgi:hypothetical protein
VVGKYVEENKFEELPDYIKKQHLEGQNNFASGGIQITKTIEITQEYGVKRCENVPLDQLIESVRLNKSSEGYLARDVYNDPLRNQIKLLHKRLNVY